MVKGAVTGVQKKGEEEAPVLSARMLCEFHAMLSLPSEAVRRQVAGWLAITYSGSRLMQSS